MATKPIVRIPEWASSGSKTDPGLSKESVGWQAAEKVPAEWLNFIENAFAQWLLWSETSIDDLEADKLDKVSADPLEFDTFADSDARIFDSNAPAGSRYPVLSLGSAGSDVRVYYTGNSIEVAYNCYWVQGTGWVASTGILPGMIEIAPAEGDHVKIVGHKTISSGAFASSAALSLDPEFKPSGNNEFSPLSLASVSATISTTTGSTTGAVSANSYGVDSVASSNDITGIISVTLDDPMDGVDYQVQITNRGSTLLHYSPSVTTSSLITVRAFTAAGAALNLSSLNTKFDLTVYGKR